MVSDIGGFGGLFAPDFAGMKEPVLVSGTDGVGTKIRIAQLMDKHDTVVSSAGAAATFSFFFITFSLQIFQVLCTPMG